MKQLNWYQIFGKSNIPDGRTVLPTDDIQIWLHCANIWNKAYTTLAEVLADTTTLSALMASNNAVDYMVRSTTWATIITVPTMTDNTHPSGECFGSGIYSSARDYFYAFDNNTSTKWIADTNGVGKYIAYDFGVPIRVSKASGYCGDNFNFEIEYSDDKLAWTSTNAFLIFDSSPGSKTVEFSESTHRYWRAKFTAPAAGLAEIYSLQFESVTSITGNSTAMSYIGLNNYCANTLLADSTWCEAICNSEYFESVLNVKVPVMTDNTHPSGVAFTRRFNSGRDAYRAFDGDTTTYENRWSMNVSTPNDDYVGYQFTSLVKVCRFWIYNKLDSWAKSRSIKGFKIQGSNGGSTYTDIFTGENNNDNQTNTFIFVNTTPYTYYRVYILSGWSGTDLDIQEMQFYGREDV